jgi:PHS family inorganic phosphate transporter-like MFS transporter
MDEATLAGTILGMIIFGHLADRVGRQGLYGYELMIILCAIGGVAFSSEGYMMSSTSGDEVIPSMNIYASIFWWRFVLGFGIGAEVIEGPLTHSRFSCAD